MKKSKNTDCCLIDSEIRKQSKKKTKLATCAVYAHLVTSCKLVTSNGGLHVCITVLVLYTCQLSKCFLNKENSFKYDAFEIQVFQLLFLWIYLVWTHFEQIDEYLNPYLIKGHLETLAAMQLVYPLLFPGSLSPLPLSELFKFWNHTLLLCHSVCKVYKVSCFQFVFIHQVWKRKNLSIFCQIVLMIHKYPYFIILRALQNK